MNVVDKTNTGSASDELSPQQKDAMKCWVETLLEEEMKKREAAHTFSMAIVATKGTLDMAQETVIPSRKCTAMIKRDILGLFSKLPQEMTI